MLRFFARSISLVSLAVALLTACTRHTLIDVAMSSAYRPVRSPMRLGRYLVLAGDTHCHVQPPDSPHHVDRLLPETVALAHEEGLDFVVLTPHVPARFFANPVKRASFVRAHAELRAAVSEAEQDAKGLVLIPGLEYTDYEYGHVTVAFGDLDEVLAAVPLEVGAAHPEVFFEQWVARGGVLVINHPLLTPIASVFSVARNDLSWRPFTVPGPYPAEIEAVTRLAHGIEVYNLGVSHMRDGLLLGDRERTVKTASFLVDREARRHGRRIAFIGGTDSHTHHLRATTYVLAEAKTERAIRDAIVGGRTCVRAPEACSFEGRDARGVWGPIGGALVGTAVELRASGATIEIIKNGVIQAHPGDGEIVRVDVEPTTCTTLRARVGEGLSAPIYVNCLHLD